MGRNPSLSWRLLLRAEKLLNGAKVRSQSKPKLEATPTQPQAHQAHRQVWSQSKPKLEATPTEDNILMPYIEQSVAIQA